MAIFFADGCEEIEGSTVVDLLFVRYPLCDMVSVSDSYQVTSSHEVTFLCNKLIIVDINAYAMLVLLRHSWYSKPCHNGILSCRPSIRLPLKESLLIFVLRLPFMRSVDFSVVFELIANPGFQHVLVGEGRAFKRPCGSGWSVHYQPGCRYRF